MAMPYSPDTGSKLGELLGIWDTDTLTTFPDMVLPLFSDQSNIEVKHLASPSKNDHNKDKSTFGNLYRQFFFQHVTKRVSQSELKWNWGVFLLSCCRESNLALLCFTDRSMLCQLGRCGDVGVGDLTVVTVATRPGLHPSCCQYGVLWPTILNHLVSAALSLNRWKTAMLPHYH